MEWTIVTVLIALVGFGAAVIKPIISLTQSITKLTTVVDRLQVDMLTMTSKNSETHTRIWKRTEEQDERIDDHERRITVIESK